MRMKKIGIILIGTILLGSCGESRTPLEEIVDLRCECLNKYDEKKDNLLEMVNCLKLVNAKEKFSELSEEDILNLMKETCPESALPQRKMETE